MRRRTRTSCAPSSAPPRRSRASHAHLGVARAAARRRRGPMSMMRPDAGPYLVSTAAVVVENTHNFGGGTVQPLERAGAAAGRHRDAGVALHLDGARLWNAHVATGVPLAAVRPRCSTPCRCACPRASARRSGRCSSARRDADRRGAGLAQAARRRDAAGRHPRRRRRCTRSTTTSTGWPTTTPGPAAGRGDGRGRARRRSTRPTVETNIVVARRRCRRMAVTAFVAAAPLRRRAHVCRGAGCRARSSGTSTSTMPGPPSPSTRSPDCCARPRPPPDPEPLRRLGVGAVDRPSAVDRQDDAADEAGLRRQEERYDVGDLRRGAHPSEGVQRRELPVDLGVGRGTPRTSPS